MMKISLKLVHLYMTIFFNFSPALSHLHPLQVENCGSNLRLVVDEMTMVNSGLKGLITLEALNYRIYILTHLKIKRVKFLKYVQFESKLMQYLLKFNPVEYKYF